MDVAVSRSPASWALKVSLLLVASLALGALTFSAQGFLPDALTSLANSASGWTILTAGLVLVARPGVAAGAVLGAVSFVLPVLGYTAAAELDGLHYDPVPWGAVGLLAGPFVGAAASALRSPSPSHAALGSALLGSVFVADGLHGLLVIGDTTSPVYWTAVLVAGLALVACVASLRLWPSRDRGRLIGLQFGALVVLLAAAAAAFSVLDTLLGSMSGSG